MFGSRAEDWLPTCAPNKAFRKKEHFVDREAHLAEKTPRSAALALREVDVDVVILARDRLLDERLAHRVAIHFDRVVVQQRKLGSRSRLVDADAQTLLNLVSDRLVELRTAVAVALEALWRGHTDLVEDLEDDAAVPEDFLERQIVYANGLAQLDVRDCRSSKWSALPAFGGSGCLTH